MENSPSSVEAKNFLYSYRDYSNVGWCHRLLYIEKNSDYDEKRSLKMFPLGQQTGYFIYILVLSCRGDS